MPYYYFVEKWTPLKLLGIRFFIDDENRMWMKMWSFRRRRMG